MKESKAIQNVKRELHRARGLFPEMMSPHDGIAIIREEYLELEKEIFAKVDERNINHITTEASQLAAMALRFLIDIC